MITGHQWNSQEHIYMYFDDKAHDHPVYLKNLSMKWKSLLPLGWCVTFSVDGSVMQEELLWGFIIMCLCAENWELSWCQLCVIIALVALEIVRGYHYEHLWCHIVICHDVDLSSLMVPQVFMKTTSSATSGMVTLSFQCIKLTKRMQNHNRMITDLEWLFLCDSYDWWLCFNVSRSVTRPAFIMYTLDQQIASRSGKNIYYLTALSGAGQPIRITLIWSVDLPRLMSLDFVYLPAFDLIRWR